MKNVTEKPKPIRRELWEFDVALVDLIQRKLRMVPVKEVCEQYGDVTLVEFVERMLDP